MSRLRRGIPSSQHYGLDQVFVGHDEESPQRKFPFTLYVCLISLTPLFNKRIVETVIAYAMDGANVAISGRSQATLDKTAAVIHAAVSGAQIPANPTDASVIILLSSSAAISKYIEKIFSMYLEMALSSTIQTAESLGCLIQPRQGCKPGHVRNTTDVAAVGVSNKDKLKWGQGTGQGYISLGNSDFTGGSWSV
ncbi:hypothetical protein EDB92DRAFT_1819729 [Lactarius akahatsu]|uniref:Uncharacterized protein n=1 Tax=Lactarius akahatsu TaxID=416441 RepID=A0AAD4L6Z2_9AGAM|nr:hypothetical protein EDB92DRAFT_1819729 [Lactarius akahatsu]